MTQPRSDEHPVKRVPEPANDPPLDSEYEIGLGAYLETVGTVKTDTWGFLVVRTAFAADDATDTAQWSEALTKLREYALDGLGQYAGKYSKPLRPENFCLATVSDRALVGFSYAQLRRQHTKWSQHYDKLVVEGPDDPDAAPSPRWLNNHVFLVVDAPGLKSLLDAPPEPLPHEKSELVTEGNPWVVAVDKRDPVEAGNYISGGPYQGFMRVAASGVAELYHVLMGSGGEMQDVCEVRRYDGQIPFYKSYDDQYLVDPEGGGEGRYVFPVGTLRGRDQYRERMAEMERALGSSVYYG